MFQMLVDQIALQSSWELREGGVLYGPERRRGRLPRKGGAKPDGELRWEAE